MGCGASRQAAREADLTEQARDAADLTEPALKELKLPCNKIGDEGMRHLGDALARGAAPAIKTIGIDGLEIYLNPAGDAARQAVEDVLKNRSK